MVLVGFTIIIRSAVSFSDDCALARPVGIRNTRVVSATVLCNAFVWGATNSEPGFTLLAQNYLAADGAQQTRQPDLSEIENNETSLGPAER
jgi:hypothetical protein